MDQSLNTSALWKEYSNKNHLEFKEPSLICGGQIRKTENEWSLWLQLLANSRKKIAHMQMLVKLEEDPRLTISPKSFISNLGKIFGSTSIKTDNANFDSQYQLKGKNQEITKKIIQPITDEILMIPKVYITCNSRHFYGKSLVLLMMRTTQVPQTAEALDLFFRLGFSFGKQLKNICGATPEPKSMQDSFWQKVS